MANASRPTCPTRHMDITHFSLMEQVATDQLILMSISTHDNPADGLTKSLRPHLFRRYCTTLFGKREAGLYRLLKLQRQSQDNISVLILFLIYLHVSSMIFNYHIPQAMNSFVSNILPTQHGVGYDM